MPSVSAEFLFVAFMPAVPAALLVWMSLSRDAEPPKKPVRDTLAGLLIAAAAFPAAWALDAPDNKFWPLVLAGAGWIAAIATLAHLFYRARGRFLFFWVPIVAVLCVGVSVSYDADQKARGRLDAQKRLAEERERYEKDAAKALADAKQSWTPGKGVAALDAQPFLAWLAVPPQVEIDGEYEREKGASATREITLKITMLNNSFEDLAPRNTRDPAWRVAIARDGQTVAEWREEERRRGGGFSPAEKREVEIPWNGRAADGALAEPGTYAVRLWLDAFAGSSRSLELPLEIRNSGPIVIVDPDPMAAQLRQQDETVRQLQRNMEQQRQLQQMIDLTRTLRFPGR